VDERVPVERLIGDGAHDEHVERALNEIGFRGHIKPF
jgi:hypothetical protein